MKYIILLCGIISIFVVTVLNFYPDETKEFINKTFYGKEFIMPVKNEYFLNDDFKYIESYTDDVSNREQLLDYIYYVINTGSEYADGECTKEYKNCIADLSEIAKNNEILSIINNFVHPYNSFKTISFTYNESGDFSLIVEHIYSDEEIAAINYVVDNKIKTSINDEMSMEQKIRIVHDYIIDNTKYDELKTHDIYDSTYKSNTAYGVLIQGFGICSGYSDAVSIFLNKLGIENYKISNETHIWNLLKINGMWVHMDATWDDPVSDINQNRDTYFLINYDKLISFDDNTHDFNKNVYLEAY